MSLTSTDLAGGPPKREDLTLMAMPTEILETILEFTVENEAGVQCVVEENQRTVTWLHPWVAELLLVSKGFSEVAKKVVGDQSVLAVVQATEIELTKALTEEKRFLRLNTFPKYLMDNTRKVEVVQARTWYLLPFAEMDVSAFPKLRRLVFVAGSIDTMLEGLTKAWTTVEAGRMAAAYPPDIPIAVVAAASGRSLEMIRTFLKILMDPRIMSSAEAIAMAADLNDAIDRTTRGPTAMIYHTAILRRLKSSDIESAPLLYSKIATEMLQLSPDCVKHLKHDTDLVVEFSTCRQDAAPVSFYSS